MITVVSALATNVSASFWKRESLFLLLLSAPVKVNESREQESMADLLGGDHREPPQSDAVAEANQRVALETSSSPFFFIL